MKAHFISEGGKHRLLMKDWSMGKDFNIYQIKAYTEDNLMMVKNKEKEH